VTVINATANVTVRARLARLLEFMGSIVAGVAAWGSPAPEFIESAII
jgi:hypothetical protein